MALDTGYTTGVIAVKEKNLLKERLFRLAETTLEEAFRTLLESGFGGGAETAASPYDYELLIAAEEKSLDTFIREYAPSKADLAYLLSPRDFHNAKALFKAKYLSLNEEKMLAGEGLIPIELLSSCITSSDFSPLAERNAELKTACEEAARLFAEERVSGAEIGSLFDKACYRYLSKACARHSLLRKFVVAKADMTNILTALRVVEKEKAEEKYLSGGNLPFEKLSVLTERDPEKILKAFSGTLYAHFVSLCVDALEKNKPFSAAEKLRDGYETEYLSARKYELEKDLPYLYYVFRRMVENANIRVIFVGHIVGLSEAEIKSRLRAF